MSGVFLSYSRGDRALANSIIRGLRAVGVVVWWDEDMHSIDWNKELERQIVELATIVVLWTPNSANSDNVKDEARLGLESNKLINVIVGLPKPPYPFDRVNGLPLEDWKEHEPHSGWTRLVHTIEEKVVAKGGAAKGEFSNALARQEEALKQRQQTYARAQEALEDAEAREAETTEAVQAAQGAFTRAEEQHLRVLEMRATHLIMSAAAQEYEAARAAKEDAERAMRAAKAEVKGATREVALAKAALESPDAKEPQRRPRAGAPPLSAKADAAETPAPPAIEPPAPSVAIPPAARPVKPAGPVAAPVTATPLAAATERPAAAPSPALSSPVEAAAPAKPATSGRSNLMLVGVAAGLMAAVAVVAFFMGHHNGPSPAPAPSSVAATSPAPATASAAADPKAAAVKAAAAIAGNWAPQGLSCDTPIVIAVKDGGVSMTVAGSTSTAAIEASPEAGVINAKAEDGGKYVYKLGQDKTLSMVDPGQQTMKMSKCAG